MKTLAALARAWDLFREAYEAGKAVAYERAEKRERVYYRPTLVRYRIADRVGGMVRARVARFVERRREE